MKNPAFQDKAGERIQATAKKVAETLPEGHKSTEHLDALVRVQLMLGLGMSQGDVKTFDAIVKALHDTIDIHAEAVRQKM